MDVGIPVESGVKGKNMENPITDKYFMLLVDALKEFYVNDAKDMFENKMADERAMVGCIYRYMWNIIVRESMDCDIDIEYDRMRGKDGDLCRKCIDGMPSNCSTMECDLRCDVILFERKDRDEDYKYNFRPDIIIHHRNMNGPDDNIMVVEVKKSCADDELFNFDRAKVSWCTCSKGCLKYHMGVFVVLYDKYAMVEKRYLDGEWMQPVKIDASVPVG